MSRIQELENIIIGTLIGNYGEYWPSVRCCITADMVSDPLNRELFMQMEKGGDVNLKTLSAGRPKEEVSRMLGLFINCDFEYKKCKYNELQYLFSDKPKYTTVTFDDYVSAFVKLFFDG